MAQGFHSFVVFAEMRTGSNLLEANLNAFEDITCHGEAFNPHFIGYPNRDDLLGVSLEQRHSNPVRLLDRIAESDGMNGFRYFHDHDARVLDRVLDDPGWAKIILTRDPLDSYVSWKIARSTGQWKLTDIKRRRDALVHFDPVEFGEHASTLEEFRGLLVWRLQASGQTAFRLRYEDLQSLDVMNGIARFLGSASLLEKLDVDLKVQNPEPLSSKVSNPAEMQAALTQLSVPDLDHGQDFEPRRFAVVPTYIVGARTPLIFLPIRSGPTERVQAWMAALDGVAPDQLETGMSQKHLRQWKRTHKGHRSFTVVRHPVLRAHHAYCAHLLGSGPRVFTAIRNTLVRRYGMPIPQGELDPGYDRAAHRAGFVAFLEFLKGNLSGQSAIRVDPCWSSQAVVIQGFAGFAAPDMILREDELPDLLPGLARHLGYPAPDFPPPGEPQVPFDLSDIYDDEIEALAAASYQRDYMVFGFDRWRG